MPAGFRGRKTAGRHARVRGHDASPRSLPTAAGTTPRSAATTFRLALRDTSLADVHIPARCMVMGVIGAANRDPSVGHGEHFCSRRRPRPRRGAHPLREAPLPARRLSPGGPERALLRRDLHDSRPERPALALPTPLVTGLHGSHLELFIGTRSRSLMPDPADQFGYLASSLSAYRNQPGSGEGSPHSVGAVPR